MNIVIVADGLGYGGTEKVIVNYSHLLQQSGHQVEIINLKPKEDQIVGLLDNKIKVSDFKLDSLMTPYLYYFGVKKWTWAICVLPFIVLITKVLLFFKKLFYIKRSYDIAFALSGHFNDLTFVAYKFINAKKKIAWIHGSLSGYLHVSDGYGHLYKKFDTIVTISMYNHEVVMFANKWLSDLDFIKIYNPVDFSDKSVTKDHVSELKYKFGDYLLMVGRMDQTKDHVTLIQAMKHLEITYGLKNKLVFVGDGPNRKNLENLVNELNLNEIVFFEGSKLNVEDYYSSAKLFLHSSPLEGLPTVIIEAMFFGLPVIASDSIPGVREIIGDNEYGLIVNVGDSSAFSEKIYEILHNDEIYRNLQEKSYKRYMDFSFETISKDLDAILY